MWVHSYVRDILTAVNAHVGYFQHTNFNEDTTNESATVACSNIRLWKLDSQKEWRNTSGRLWDKKKLRRMLRVSWTAKKTNEWVLSKAGVKKELLDTVKARKLAYYGHTMRKQGSCLEKEIMQGTIQVHVGEEGHARPGWTTSRCGQDSPWKSRSEWQRTGINGESASIVWLILGSRMAKEQNRTGYFHNDSRIENVK